MKKVILPNEKPIIETNKSAKRLHGQLVRIIESINEKEVPEETADFLNQAIEKLNKSNLEIKKQLKAYRSVRNEILRQVQKRHNWVSRNHYRTLYTGFGLAAIGVPMGLALGLSLESMAYLGLGLPFGLIVGLLIGQSFDRKAKEENRVINYEE